MTTPAVHSATPEAWRTDLTEGLADRLTDPVRDEFRQRRQAPDLDAILGLFPRTTGEPAFDPTLIRGNIERLATVPEVNTGHPFLDLSVKTGLAHIDATFKGDHPRYGVKFYGESRHDAFPPTIIAAVDALSAWGLRDRAAQLFRYWLATFVNEDGTIRYYGPSVSEYGQLLHTAAVLFRRIGPEGWWDQGQRALPLLANHLLGLCTEADQTDDLVRGIPEADISVADPNNVSDTTHSQGNRYFHNNAWVARGLMSYADLMARAAGGTGADLSRFRLTGDRLAARTLAAIQQTWPRDPDDWWLPPQLETSPRPRTLFASTLGSYTNYRYWPELLSSGILPPRLGRRVAEARLAGGGQFCGMTRFMDHLDDWPLADYLFGLWRLERKEDFLLGLYGHAAYHQAEGHLTAYEQVSYPPGKEMGAPYCLPCQLVAARAARLLMAGAVT